MPKYYVSKNLSIELSPVYVEEEKPWGATMPDGETNVFGGAMPPYVLKRVEEIDSCEAQRLIELRQAEEARRLRAQRQESRGWLAGRTRRTKALIALGALVVLGIVIFVVAWENHVNDPIYRYWQVEVGMTYEEVADLIGPLGGADPSESIPDGTYKWTRRGGMLFFFITFEDGRVTQKDIQNWEI